MPTSSLTTSVIASAPCSGYAALMRSLVPSGSSTQLSRGMPIVVAAPVGASRPTSWIASVRPSTSSPRTSTQTMRPSDVDSLGSVDRGQRDRGRPHAAGGHHEQGHRQDDGEAGEAQQSGHDASSARAAPSSLVTS